MDSMAAEADAIALNDAESIKLFDAGAIEAEIHA